MRELSSIVPHKCRNYRRYSKGRRSCLIVVYIYWQLCIMALVEGAEALGRERGDSARDY
jgi:hypothetical protein